MDSKQLTALCEAMGFGIAHARRQRDGEVRAYVSCWKRSAKATPRDSRVDELRWHPRSPDEISGWHHATKPNGYTQYDKFVCVFPITPIEEN